MAYIGNIPAEAYTNTVKDSFNGTGSATAFTLSQPTVTNDVRVVVENVVQDPTVAYSVSGTTLTFTSAPPSGTANIYVVHLGSAVMTSTPPSEIADATTFASNVSVQGSFTSQGIDDNATSTAMTLDGSGKLLVGTTDTTPYNNSAGTSADQGFVVSGGRIYAATNANSVSILNRTSTDGDIVQFRKDGSTVGSIGTYANEYYHGSAVGGDTFLRHGYSGIVPATSSGTNRDAAIQLGSSVSRFSDLYLSGGVYLGGTGAANKLDDYEEGTWTPVYSDATSGGNTGVANGGKRGKYTKIGNLVTVIASCSNLNTAGMTGGNDLIIQGLPFVCISLSGTPTTFWVGATRLGTISFDGFVSANIFDGAQYVRLSESRNGQSVDQITVSNLSSGAADIHFTITYETSA